MGTNNYCEDEAKKTFYKLLIQYTNLIQWMRKIGLNCIGENLFISIKIKNLLDKNKELYKDNEQDDIILREQKISKQIAFLVDGMIAINPKYSEEIEQIIY